MKKFNFNTQLYNFKEIFCEWLGCDDLTKLHLEKSYDVLTREKDMYMHWNQNYYNRWRSGDDSIKNMYLKFLKNEIKPRFGEEIVYQELPDIRIHLCDNISVGSWHKDSTYRNEAWARKVREVNYFVPLTNAYDTATFWAETKEDMGDFIPVEACYGECVEWNGSFLKHGNKLNETGKTRVSFDFRVIPLSRYEDSDHTSVNMKIPFKIGGFYGGVI